MKTVSGLHCRLMVWLLAALTAWLVAHGAVAAEGVGSSFTTTPGVVEILRADKQKSLSASLYVLEDASKGLSDRQALAQFEAGQFAPGTLRGQSDNNFGMSTSAYWLAVRLQAARDAPTDWLLEVAYPPLDQVDLYTRLSDGSMQRLSSGDLLDFELRPVAHRNHVFPVSLAPGAQVTLMLRLESQGTLAAPVKLWQPAEFATHSQREYALLSLYFGLLGGLLGYNLLLYFSVKDRVYLIYVGFVAWLAMTEAALTGLGIQFVWPTLNWWNSILPPFGMAVSSGFAIAFARVFLSSRVLMPRTDKVLLGLIVFCGLTCLAALTLPYSLASRMVTALAAAAVITLVTAGVLAVRSRHPGARIFLAAWSVLLLGVAVLGLHNNGLVPSNLLTANFLLIGSALEMLLLSFALADRINQARAEKDLALARNQAQQELLVELQRSQRQLQETSSEREAILNSALMGIVLSVARNHQWVNEKFAQMMGFKRDELIGRSSRYIHPDDESWEKFGRVARASLIETNAYDTELQLQRSNGERFWVVMAGSCLTPKDPDSGVIWTFLDITERKQAEDETRLALAQQQELNLLRSRFVSMTSHEFRTPLASIQSSQELLAHYGSRLPESEVAQLLASIGVAVQRMTHMLDRMLLIGKAQANMLDFTPQAISLPSLCQSLVDEACQLHPNASSTVTLDISPEVREGLFDPKLMRHIFSNLLSNAIKYSPQGGEVRFCVRREESRTVFTVTDQGIGIPALELPHLFETFHRASNVGDIAGTGLGLAIVKSSVDLHRGRIEVQSQPGQGTRFTVWL
jgi:PAS domain S-box-containing protein